MLYSLSDIEVLEDNINSDAESRNRNIEYFRLFLNELNIPEKCFISPKGKWTFNEDGRKLFMQVLFSTKPAIKTHQKKIYSDIRNGIFSAEYSAEYSWILDCICSNLSSLVETDSAEKSNYPLEPEIRSRFWGGILVNINQDMRVLPGYAHLADLVLQEEFFDLIKISALQDIIYIDHRIQKEFEDIAQKHRVAYEGDCERAVKKWWNIIFEMTSYRAKQRKQKLQKPQPEFEELIEILNGVPTEPFYTQGKSLAYMKARKKEREIYLRHLIEYIEKISPQIQTLFPEPYTDCLSSEELFERIMDEYPQLNAEIAKPEEG